MSSARLDLGVDQRVVGVLGGVHVGELRHDEGLVALDGDPGHGLDTGVVAHGDHGRVDRLVRRRRRVLRLVCHRRISFVSICLRWQEWGDRAQFVSTSASTSSAARTAASASSAASCSIMSAATRAATAARRPPPR